MTEKEHEKAGEVKEKAIWQEMADKANKKPMYEYTGFFVHLLRI